MSLMLLFRHHYSLGSKISSRGILNQTNFSFQAFSSTILAVSPHSFDYRCLLTCRNLLNWEPHRINSTLEFPTCQLEKVSPQHFFCHPQGCCLTSNFRSNKPLIAQLSTPTSQISNIEILSIKAITSGNCRSSFQICFAVGSYYLKKYGNEGYRNSVKCQ